MSTQPPIVSDAQAQDIAAICRIHCQAMPDHLLPRMGRAFLEKHYYPKLLAFEGAFVLVCRAGEEIQAFAVFVTDKKAFDDFTSCANIGYIPHLIGTVIKHPSCLMDILSILRGSRPVMFSADSDISAIPELFTIATAPGHQGKGLGKRLVAEGLRRLPAGPCIAKASSQGAKEFYEKCGLVKAGKEQRGATRAEIFMINLPEQRPSE